MDVSQPDPTPAEEEDTFIVSQPPPGYQPDSVKVLAIFLLYSMALFSLPFLAFFGTKHVLKDTFHVEGFANTAWSVISAVIVVNVIILLYACRGYAEEEDAEETEKGVQPVTSGVDAKKTN